jgi:methyl-accepting chemotaxis protein
LKKLIFLIVFFNLALTLISKEYYIGDIIKFNIESNKEEKDIAKAFKDFEIEKIEKNEKGFIVTARAYSIGKKKVEIDKKSFEMEIKSLISENYKDIEESYDDKKSIKINMINEKIEVFPYTYIIFLIVFILIILLILFVIRMINKKLINPYKKFKKELKDAQNGDYFKEAILIFKIYIEKRTGIKTKDKTTAESELELKKIYSEMEILLIKDIMEIADTYKFMKKEYGEKEVENHMNKVLDLGKIIEEKFKKKEKGDVK